MDKEQAKYELMYEINEKVVKALYEEKMRELGELCTVASLSTTYVKQPYNREVLRYAKKHKCTPEIAFKKIYGFEPIDCPKPL